MNATEAFGKTIESRGLPTVFQFQHLNEAVVAQRRPAAPDAGPGLR